jgi:hypothetical protein
MKPIQSLALRVAAVVAGSAVIGACIATNPATARDVTSMLGAIGLTTCSLSTPCKKFQNNGSGAGVEGIANTGNGVIAKSTSGSATISTSTYADGVQAYSSNNDGTNSGTNNNSSQSSGRSGVWGHDDSTDGGQGNVGVAGSSTNGVGVSGSSSAFVGVLGSSPSAQGGAFTGGYIGVEGQAPAGTATFPLVLVDTSGNSLDYTNGNGDIFVHGSYNNFARVRNGNFVVSYGATSAAPSVEDNGTAQMVNGVAVVKLDATFAHAIDLSQAYHVMITPDGDTRGLFVASKSLAGFVVREVQGGHGTLSFDYRVLGAKLGHANERMTEMTPAQAQLLMPRATIVHPAKHSVKTH